MSRQKERDLVCKPFAKTLKHYEALGLTVTGLIWTHIANEQVRWGKGSDQQNAIMGKHLKDMGKRAGWPDYMFIWQDNKGVKMLFLEAKAPDTSLILKGEQLQFQLACDRAGIPHHVFNEWQQGISYLRDYGVIKA